MMMTFITQGVDIYILKGTAKWEREVFPFPRTFLLNLGPSLVAGKCTWSHHLLPKIT